jgi:hypothetical protein
VEFESVLICAVSLTGCLKMSFPSIKMQVKNFTINF